MTKGIVPPVLSLEGRRALVTGGGTGIGKACATALAAAGASVTICGPDLAVLEAACGDLARLDLHDVKAITADITDEAQVATAVDAAAMDGGLDIAVANAGVAFPGSLLHIGADHWMGPIGVNVIGTAHTIKHAARAMMEGGGSIITISSIASTRPAAFMSTYSVSKAAVDELTRVAAAELGRFGIRVNGIRPGWMRTETVEATTDEHNLAMIRRDTPLAAEHAARPARRSRSRRSRRRLPGRRLLQLDHRAAARRVRWFVPASAVGRLLSHRPTAFRRGHGTGL